MSSQFGHSQSDEFIDPAEERESIARQYFEMKDRELSSEHPMSSYASTLRQKVEEPLDNYNTESNRYSAMKMLVELLSGDAETGTGTEIDGHSDVCKRDPNSELNNDQASEVNLGIGQTNTESR
ncbi:uncharacterized protein I303_105678 [Kwoniella dejecticola CBS 10117]|uniref:Uncharacterized protein n=1 Tax=Kwoniella dejecticola CBS 10117 TaxID=1296121 RepID=A0A1A6A037_9TREE|nr:uncharacterized protein I303_05700 [Kwoniella dejecticola CBS 10117]OBR83422.1 hypothetical protein I303_05700 [Kwoniella dejecticola CBS 10117]